MTKSNDLELALVSEDDPNLHHPCHEFDFNNPPFDPVEFSKNFVKFMRDNGGIGLSANQVGVPYSIFAMRAHPENFVCFNPKVVQPSEQQIVLEENSLTFKGLIAKIKRPQHIRVRYTQPNGEVVTKQFTGMAARVFQHQMDFLDGVMFFNRANRYHRDQAFKKWKKHKARLEKL